jgi:hypothetical protein
LLFSGQQVRVNKKKQTKGLKLSASLEEAVADIPKVKPPPAKKRRGGKRAGGKKKETEG